MRRLLPDPADGLDDDDLLAAYAPPEPAARHLRVNFVTSADGAGTLDGLSGGLSSPADKRVFALLRDLADVVLVGAGTVRAENYGYPTPGPQRRARRPERGRAEVPVLAVVSGALDLDPGARLFREAAAAEAAGLARPVVLTAAGAPADRRAALEPVADVLVAGEEHVDLARALDELAGRGLPRVLCEGGPTLFGTLAAGGLLDELCLTVSPLLAGAGAGRVIAGPRQSPTRLAVRHVLEEDGTLFLRYAADGAAHVAAEQAG